MADKCINESSFELQRCVEVCNASRDQELGSIHICQGRRNRLNEILRIWSGTPELNRRCF